MIMQIIVAGVGTVAFSILFGVPKLYYPYCGIIGSAGWFIYSILVGISSEPIATFFAAIIVIILSRLFAVLKKCPVTIFLISGIFPLVPGAKIYWTAYYIVTDKLTEANSAGFLAFKIVVAIVLGIVFIFEIPQKIFKIVIKK